MQFLNHYSAPILVGFLLAGGLCIVLRRGGKTREWLLLGAAVAFSTASWLVLRPVAKPLAASPGKACLLEIQSPYCLACLALKPGVDRLETTLRGNLVVRRVDIQSDEGQRLAKEYNIEFTPTFIFFDEAGREQWRSIGKIDTASVRHSLQSPSSPPESR